MEPRTSQSNDGIEGRYDDGEQQPDKPPEECMDKFSFSENEVTYTRKVFTTIVGSSVLETAARTSGYGESLINKVGKKYVAQDGEEGTPTRVVLLLVRKPLSCVCAKVIFGTLCPL